MSTLNRVQRPRRRQAGLSLVELMVGVAVGLFIVAGAAVLVSGQLGENRRLLVETQIQQDLRAAADIITRELRRAGYLAQPQTLIWNAQEPTKQPVANLSAGLKLNGGDVVSYSYERPPAAPSDNGYQLVGKAIRQRIGSSVQDLTDSSTLSITKFTVALQPLPAQQLACPALCADGTQSCWPTLKMVDATVTIEGEAVGDSAIHRSVVSRVRLRNDFVDFGGSPQVCP